MYKGTEELNLDQRNINTIDGRWYYGWVGKN